MRITIQPLEGHDHNAHARAKSILRRDMGSK